MPPVSLIEPTLVGAANPIATELALAASGRVVATPVAGPFAIVNPALARGAWGQRSAWRFMPNALGYLQAARGTTPNIFRPSYIPYPFALQQHLTHKKSLVVAPVAPALHLLTDIAATTYTAMLATQNLLPTAQPAKIHQTSPATEPRITDGSGNGGPGGKRSVNKISLENVRSVLHPIQMNAGNGKVTSRYLSFAEIHTRVASLETVEESMELSKIQKDDLKLLQSYQKTIDSLHTDSKTFELALQVYIDDVAQAISENPDFQATVARTPQQTRSIQAEIDLALEPIKHALITLNVFVSQPDAVNTDELLQDLATLNLREIFVAHFLPDPRIAAQTLAKIPQQEFVYFLAKNLFDVPGRVQFNQLVQEKISAAISENKIIDLRAVRPEPKDSGATGDTTTGSLSIEAAGSAGDRGEGESGSDEQGQNNNPE